MKYKGADVLTHSGEDAAEARFSKNVFLGRIPSVCFRILFLQHDRKHFDKYFFVDMLESVCYRTVT